MQKLEIRNIEDMLVHAGWRHTHGSNEYGSGRPKNSVPIGKRKPGNNQKNRQRFFLEYSIL